ncbi:MAG: class F sortase [Thermoflexaceae bacterium]|nr:class F sortase [Thermoflexaceae bacterium]
MRMHAGMMVAGVLLTAALAACGGSESAPTSAPTSTPSAAPSTATATTPPPSPTPQPTATPAPSGPPTGMVIPSIGTNLPARAVGLTAAQQIEHVAQGEVGIYSLASLPGVKGNSFWVGNSAGTFRDQLDTVREGADVFVTTESGGRYVYSVVSLTRYTAATIRMGELIYPKLDPAEERLTIITTASVDPVTQLDDSWWVVVANRKP